MPPAHATRRIDRTIVVVAIFLGLHLLALLGRPLPLWGTDFLVDVPAPWRVAFLAAGLLLTATARAGIADRGQGAWGASIQRFDPWNGTTTFLAFVVLLMLAGGALFTGLRSATHLLGDGQLHVRALHLETSLEGWANNNAPFTYWIARRLHGVVGRLGGSQATTYQVFSILSGMLYVAIASATARTLGRSRDEKNLLLGFLLTAGFLPIFFGYIESYALHLPVVLLYLALGIRARQRRRFPWGAACLLGVAVSLHFSLASLIPSLAAAAWIDRSGSDGSSPGRAWAAKGGRAILAVFSTLAIAAGILFLTGFDGELFRSAGSMRHFLPIGAEPGFVHPYRLLDPRHAVDVLSQWLLVAPAALLVLSTASRTRPRTDKRDEVFLALATFFPLLFTFVANPEIGAFRDWDAFAFAAIPMTLWAAMRFVRGAESRDRPRAAGRLILGAAALHTLLWIGVNADAGASERRFARLLDETNLSSHARSYGWECLGSRHWSLGRGGPALACFEKAAVADPANPRHWNSLGMLRFDGGDPKGALNDFRRAIALDEMFPKSHYNLALAQIRLRDFRAAVGELERTVALDPSFAMAHFQLGIAYGELERWGEAAESLDRAVARSPRSPWASEARERASFAASLAEKTPSPESAPSRTGD